VADRAREAGGQLQILHERAWVGRVRVVELLSRSVLGRIELALGNMESAGVHLRDLPDGLRAAGLNDPALPLWADALGTLVMLGELDRARAHIERHKDRAQAMSSPWAIAVGARCRGR
jgi:hypothetical protein